MKKEIQDSWLRKNWIYIIAFLMPMAVLTINGIVNRAWPVFSNEGGVLYGDMSLGWAQIVYEFIHKIKNGESFFFSWNAAGGFDSFVCFTSAVFSPFTLLALLVPESSVPECLQCIMSLRWMLASVTMVYFFQNTKYNTLKEHKKIVSLFLGLAFSLGNGMIYFFENTHWNDVIMLFPLLLLQLESLAENKKWMKYYVLLTLCMLSNFYILFHICIFLVIWFIYQLCNEKEERLYKFWIFARTSVLAAGSSMILMLPYLYAASERMLRRDDESRAGFLNKMLVSFPAALSKFFSCTSLEMGSSRKPNVFFSVAGVVFVLFFLFIKEARAKKSVLLGTAIVMFASFFEGHLNIIWHGFSVPHGIYNRFVNVFVFVLLFMVLQVFIHLKEIRLRYIAIVSAIVFAVYLYVVISKKDNLELYSCIITFSLFVFYAVMLCFVRTKTISYRNGILMVCLIGILELTGNAAFILKYCTCSEFFDKNLNSDILELSDSIDLAYGERFAGNLTMYNTGMMLNSPSVNGFINFGNGNAVEMSKRLGQVYSEGVTNVTSGASPIVNLIYNIRYCAGDATGFSDIEEVASSENCNLYRTNNIAGLGYMADSNIAYWNIQQVNCFSVQNDFMKNAAGVEGIFDMVVQPVEALFMDGSSLTADQENIEQGVYSYKTKVIDGEKSQAIFVCMKAEKDYDLYACFGINVAMGIGVYLNGELVHTYLDFAEQQTIHLENIKKGDEIIYVLESPDDLRSGIDIKLNCQFANFNNDKFLMGYQKLSDEVYQISDMSSTYIAGEIDVKKQGIMMTSVPAMKGFKVLVDGKEVKYTTVGDTFIGVLLEEGKHKVEFLYETPYVRAGAFLSIMILLLTLVIYCYERLENRDCNKIVLFFRKNKIYLTAAALPWCIVFVHSLLRHSWLLGTGSILTGDAGNIYYSMYAELWDKVHDGGSLLFSWNAGLGTDFLVNIFRYLMSPATLVLLILPKAWLANGIQVLMVLKWCAMSFTMLYYFMHTKRNSIIYHKEIVSIVLAMAFCLSNTMIDNLQHMSWYDSIILFPVLLLFAEQMQEGKGYGKFVLVMTVCILCNFTIAIPISIFLVFWYVLGIEKGMKHIKKNTVRFLGSIFVSFCMGILVIVPSVFGLKGNAMAAKWDDWRTYAKASLVSATDLIQRLFVLDNRGFSVEGQPALYCSVVFVTIMLFYTCTGISLKKKAGHLLLLLFLVFGLMNGGMNLLWHGVIGVNEETNAFAFLPVFLMLYMALQVLVYMKDIKKYHTLICGIIGIAVFAYTFIHIRIYMDFYVYLLTLLLNVLLVLLLFFFSKGSIQYKNILLAVSVLAVLELSVNAYVQFSQYDEYVYEDMYYRKEGRQLIPLMDLNVGERVAAGQDIANYGMSVGQPAVSGQLEFMNEEQHVFFKQLGLGWDTKYYEYIGASPLLNTVFNVKYGMASGMTAYSDMKDTGTWQNYHLYQADRTVGIGYMVNYAVENWETEQDSPFEVQNDFVKNAVEEDNVFTTVIPEEIQCSSMWGHDSSGKQYNLGVSVHGDEKGVYLGSYDPDKNEYVYDFINAYYTEDITMQFISDGVTDYYVCVNCDCSIANKIVVGDELVYADSVVAKQRMYHIGIVEEGTLIYVISNAEVDNDDYTVWKLRYKFAGFSEENYEKAYEKLSEQVYNVEQWTDGYVSGTIDVKKAGIMMTGIPALDGFTVYVDGKQTDYDKIGGALIGVPLEEGRHTVEFKYRTPYLTAGVIVSFIGLLLAVIFFFIPYYKSNRQLKPENMAGE